MKNQNRILAYPIMLPADVPTHISVGDSSKTFSFHENSMPDYTRRTYQYLYFCVDIDTEIEGESWVIVDGKYLAKVKGIGQANVFFHSKCPPAKITNCKKIVATTDPDLDQYGIMCADKSKERRPKQFLQIPKEFLRSFAEQEGKIETVELECETMYKNKKGLQPFPDEECTEHVCQLKVTAKNECIVRIPQVETYASEIPDLIIELCRGWQRENGFNAVDFDGERVPLMKEWLAKKINDNQLKIQL